MKLKTPGSERKEKKGTESRVLHSPQPHPGHTYLLFARCLDEGPGHSVLAQSPAHNAPTRKAREPGHLQQSLGPCRAPQQARRCEG